MPSWAEVLGDGTVGSEEALGVPGRLEMLLTLSRADGSTELPQRARAERRNTFKDCFHLRCWVQATKATFLRGSGLCLLVGLVRNRP